MSWPTSISADDPAVQKIVVLYEGGMSAPEIGRRYGMSVMCVTRRLKAAGIKPRGGRARKGLLAAAGAEPVLWDDEVALGMQVQGKGTAEIARHFGVSYGSCRNALLYALNRVGRDAPTKERKCRMCLGTFPSSGAGHRVCDGCKSSDAWQAGDDSHRVVGLRG